MFTEPEAHHTRRSVLALGGACVAGSLAGCADTLMSSFSEEKETAPDTTGGDDDYLGRTKNNDAVSRVLARGSIGHSATLGWDVSLGEDEWAEDELELPGSPRIESVVEAFEGNALVFFIRESEYQRHMLEYEGFNARFQEAPAGNHSRAQWTADETDSYRVVFENLQDTPDPRRHPPTETVDASVVVDAVW